MFSYFLGLSWKDDKVMKICEKNVEAGNGCDLSNLVSPMFTIKYSYQFVSQK